MYKVIQADVIVASFALFTEAWAFARVDHKVYSLILGPDASKPAVN